MGATEMREPSITTATRPAARHVVVVRVPMQGDDLLLPLRDLQNLFIRYLRKQPPDSDYSILIMRQDGVPEVHCSFAEGGDAERLAASIHGVSTAAKEAEASRHFVELDDEILLEIAEVAGPPSFKRAKPDDSESGGPMRSVGAMRRR
jgi:hypothetical protein